MDVPTSLSAAREALLATQGRYYGQRPDVLRGGMSPVWLNPPRTAEVAWHVVDGVRRAVTVEVPAEQPAGDWVSDALVYGSGAGPVPYWVPPASMGRFIAACWQDGDPEGVALARLDREATRAVASRPNGQTSRPRWAVVDWSASADGVRAADPRDALVTLLSDLDRLDALGGRLRSLATSTPTETRAGLWRREADELAAFRTHLREANFPRLASLWAGSVPDMPPSEPTPPRRPPIMPARLR